jgi:ABC-2 type transport system ATP-binding protein
VADIIRFSRALHPRWDDAGVERWRKMFDLAEEARIGGLSKGKLTLLGLTLARGPDPDIYLLDEPFTGLDPLRRRQVLSLLMEELAGGERTILVSSHQLQDVERVVDTVGFLVDGRLILSRTLEELLFEEKRIRVQFPSGPPSDVTAWPGVRRLITEGRHHLMEVGSHLGEVGQRLDSLPGVGYEVVNQTLEDIYLSYTGGMIHDQPGIVQA